MEQPPEPGRQSARQEARAVGAKTYIGPRCHRCRGRERYTSCAGCVGCKKKQALRNQAKRRKLYAGLERFGVHQIAHPCIRCGKRRRYARSGRCVACASQAYLRKLEPAQRPQEGAGSTIGAGGLPVVNGGMIAQPGGN